MEKNNLTFVYLGEVLPSYGKSSLELACNFSGQKVQLIGNLSQLKKFNNSKVSFIPIEKFYDPKPFIAAKKILTSNEEFRNGFWHKTLERFFVLEQYMRKNDLNEIFHAELDQVLFRTDILFKNLQKIQKKGIYLPFQTQDRAIASIFYCNSLDALQSFIEFTSKATSGLFANEMQLLANWGMQNSSFIHALPTITNVIRASGVDFGNDLVDFLEIDGISDAAQLGQWVGGIDPKNLPLHIKPKTKFVDAFEPGLLKKNELAHISFVFSAVDKSLYVNFPNLKPMRLYNLHVHSKIHKWFLKNFPERLLKLANSQNEITLFHSRMSQLGNYCNWKLIFDKFIFGKLHTRIFKKINEVLGFRPSSSPFISGDSFRKLAIHVWEKNSRKIDIKNIQSGDIVFCESELFEDFGKKILAKIDVKILLILGNSDYNFTFDPTASKFSKKLIKVFAQNLIASIPSFELLPIGLENKWRANHGKINSFRILRIFPRKKIFRVMWTFSYDSNIASRIPARDALLACETADHLPNLSSQMHRIELSRYGFVACPPGNGEDTHRVWEAMYLRCVPIVIESKLTTDYKKLGLPVWVIKSYDELKSLDEDKLCEKYKEFVHLFDSEALWMDFWENKINSEIEQKKFPGKGTTID